MTYYVSSGTLNPTHSLTHFVPHFVSFTAFVAELAHRENSCIHSLTQPITQPIWCPKNWSLCFGTVILL